MELALHAHPTLVQYRYPGSGTSRDTLGRYLTPRGEPDTLELSVIKQPCEGGEGFKKSYQSTLVIIHESAPPCTRPASSSLLHWGVGNKHFGAYLGAPPVRLVQLQLQCSTEPCTPVCLFPLTLGIHSSTVACSGSNKSPPPLSTRDTNSAPLDHTRCRAPSAGSWTIMRLLFTLSFAAWTTPEPVGRAHRPCGAVVCRRRCRQGLGTNPSDATRASVDGMQGCQDGQEEESI